MHPPFNINRESLAVLPAKSAIPPASTGAVANPNSIRGIPESFVLGQSKSEGRRITLATPRHFWKDTPPPASQLLGARKCLATASGTTALIVSLHVMDVDAGDEVITSPYTFIATYNSILTTKALPVFADTDPATLTMDPASIESRITERTRAIMPVHIFGMPCDMDPINAIASRGYKRLWSAQKSRA